MKILLDTQAFLWLIGNHSQITTKAKKLFLDNRNELFLSLASIWEIAIKTSLGKLTIHQPISSFLSDQMQENRIRQLEIDFRHVTNVAKMPFHHRDPFDRLIISQSMLEKMPVISSDVIFDKYKISRYW